MPRSAGRWILLVAAVVTVIAAGTLASVLLRERSERAERAEIEAAASRFASALLTYDSADLEAARKRMRPLATEKFLTNYEATLTALAGLDSKAAGRATEVFVGTRRDSRVAVVVVTESTAETANGPRANRGTYLRLDLVWADDRWRVDQVVELASGRSEGAAPPSPD